MTRWALTAAVGVFTLLLTTALAEEPAAPRPGKGPAAAPQPPVELGRITWLRDFDEAKAQAAKTGKPVMLLFDEVPGCAGCKKFGQVMLSHPLVVDAAAEAFVPLAVRNNSKGDADAALVKLFGMPSWAYPEVRFLDAANVSPTGDLVDREPKGWQKTVLPTRMVAALQKAQRDVPPYLAILATETDARPLETACFWMFCYWTGEAKLSAVEGVRAMRIGMIGRKEVVEVDFDPKVVSFEDLAKVAKESCGKDVGVFARTDAQAATAATLGMASKASSDAVKTDKIWQKRGLMVQHPEIWFLPLTEYQSVKLGSLSVRRGNGEALESLLSPTQKALRDRLVKVSPRGQEMMRILLKDLGAPDRSFVGVIAWQTKLEQYIAAREAATP